MLHYHMLRYRMLHYRMLHYRMLDYSMHRGCLVVCTRVECAGVRRCVLRVGCGV